MGMRCSPLPTLLPMASETRVSCLSFSSCGALISGSSPAFACSAGEAGCFHEGDRSFGIARSTFVRWERSEGEEEQQAKVLREFPLLQLLRDTAVGERDQNRSACRDPPPRWKGSR